MVREVGVHDDDEVARHELEAVDVGRSETQLSRAGLEHHVRRVGLDQLLRDYLRAIGGAVVDDDEFPVELAAKTDMSVPGQPRDKKAVQEACLLFAECAVQQPGDDGQVPALVVRRQDHRVLVLRRRFLRGHFRDVVLWEG